MKEKEAGGGANDRKENVGGKGFRTDRGERRLGRGPSQTKQNAQAGLVRLSRGGQLPKKGRRVRENLTCRKKKTSWIS